MLVGTCNKRIYIVIEALRIAHEYKRHGILVRDIVLYSLYRVRIQVLFIIGYDYFIRMVFE
jgi:hypothetical protein